MVTVMSLTSARKIKKKEVLTCPRCGDEYLHQGMVSVFNRREDAPLSQCTFVNPDGVAIQALSENNPSPRRQGLEIAFECEQCGDGLFLTIIQHKGFTLAQWSWSGE